MREILFRGKQKNSGDWVEGVPIQHSDGDWQIHGGFSNAGYLVTVDPKTVCQYTGLTDKNGRKIFEGDIVRNFLCIDDHNEPLCEYGKVVYIPERAAFEIWDNDNNWITSRVNLEVIGNIFDNPELIGE